MNKKEVQFCKKVWEYYRRHGRRSLPWRRTRTPYRILVSEVMLQQTQVERVIPKYKSFLKRFPSFSALAQAPLGAVLREWQGLGYNRRAKMLHECAHQVINDYKGRFPKTHNQLLTLAGVGPYTAGSVMAFAYNKPVPIIETNIRTVFIHHFFYDDVEISDKEIIQLVERTLDVKNPREWYYALMDYGSYLKKHVGNQNVRSKHYTKQSTFKNSDRQIRGAIVRMLTVRSESRAELHKGLPFEPQRIDTQLELLIGESMVSQKKKKYTLPE